MPPITSAKSKAKAAKKDELQNLLRMIWAFGFVLLTAILWSQQAKAEETVRILSYGDSLSAGYQLPSGAGFTDQLQARLDEAGVNADVINAAVSGDTTATGLSRLDWSTPENVDLVLLELGANDALQGLPVENAKSNLAAMIEKFRAKGIEVLLIGMRAPPNMGQDYVSQFDAIFPALAETYQTHFFPFFLKDVAAEPSLNLQDGMHPNEEGIKIISRNIAPMVIDIVKTLN